MLRNSTIFAIVAVTDLVEAREFYGDILGLEETDTNSGGITYKGGSGQLFIYEAPTGGRNPATSAGWEVTGIEDIVEALKTRGVTFEHYESFPAEWRGDVAVMDSMKVAWFKDPSGNVLQLGEM